MRDKMEVEYKIIKDSAAPQVSISYDGKHIGSIFGHIDKGKEDPFDVKNNIVYIRDKDESIVAILWNAEEKGSKGDKE